MIADSQEVIRKRFGSTRPGMVLIAIEEAALPVTIVKLDVLAQERKGLPLVEEFTLRFLLDGVDSVEDLSSLMGLEEGHIVDALALQIATNRVTESADGHLGLSALGKEQARTLESVQPVHEVLDLVFDRLAWVASGYVKSSLIQKSEAIGSGRILLPASKSARLKTDDIELQKLNDIVHGGRRAHRLVEILRVRRIVSQNLFRYLPVKLLVFADVAQGDVALDVYVAGDVLPAHGLRLAEIDAATELGIHVGQASEPVDLPAEIRSARDEAEVLLEARSGTDPDTADSPDVPLVRPISVFQHRDLLDEALSTARRRLLVISPWVKNAVVNTEFLSRLESRLRLGVEVHIGYGIGSSDSDSHPRALDRLGNLAKRYENFRFTRLANSHAKVLIFDDALVITSFNWLSFVGAKERTYRMEEGTLIGVPDYVEQEYAKFVSVIAEGSPR